MNPAVTEDVGFGITRIDANYMAPGVACFYLVEGDGECAIVETGTRHSVPALQAALAERGLSAQQVRYVIPTHVHLDHAGGAGAMMALFPEAELLAHPRGARHLIDPQKLIEGSQAVYGDEAFLALYGEILPVDAARVIEVADGDVVEFGGRALHVRHTPGHADHHFCVWDARSRAWFSGDVFGVCYDWFRTPGGNFSMISTTPTQFRPEALKASLALLAEAGPETIYLTHFGPLPYSEQTRQGLLQQIDEYLEIAERCDGDSNAMAAEIIACSQRRVQAMNAGAEMDGMRDRFVHDAQLNAQGLAIWWQRAQQ